MHNFEGLFFSIFTFLFQLEYFSFVKQKVLDLFCPALSLQHVAWTTSNVNFCIELFCYSCFCNILSLLTLLSSFFKKKKAKGYAALFCCCLEKRPTILVMGLIPYRTNRIRPHSQTVDCFAFWHFFFFVFFKCEKSLSNSFFGLSKEHIT